MKEMELERIRSRLSQEEILAQLAEECCELAQASLKYRRALMGGVNPTPVTMGEALKGLGEELSDVLLCLTAARLIRPELPAELCIDWEKADRWAARLRP